MLRLQTLSPARKNSNDSRRARMNKLNNVDYNPNENWNSPTFMMEWLSKGKKKKLRYENKAMGKRLLNDKKIEMKTRWPAHESNASSWPILRFRVG